MKLLLALVALSMTQAEGDGGARARELVVQATRGHLGKDETQEITLVLVDREGAKEVRNLTRWYRRSPGGEDKSLVRFTAPAEIAGTALLSVQGAKGTDQWLYLPQLKRVKRIVTSDFTGYFVSTDFTYQDLLVEAPDDYLYELGNAETIDGAGGKLTCRKVTALPKDEEIARRSGYSKRILWIDEGERLLRRVDFFDSSGRMTKTLLVDEYADKKGLKKAVQYRIDNTRRSHKTYVRVGSTSVDTGLKETMFRQSELER